MADNRRELLKKSAVAAGVVGVAWSAPRVEGLSLRPDYAAAQSGQVCSAYQIRPGTGSVIHPVNGDTLSLNMNEGGPGAVSSVTVEVRGDGGVLTNCSVNMDKLSTDQLSSVDFSVKGMGGTADVALTSVNQFAGFAFGYLIASGYLCCD